MKKPQWITIANTLGITVIRGVRKYTVNSDRHEQWEVTSRYIQLEHARKKPDGYWKHGTVEITGPFTVEKIGKAINEVLEKTQP